MKRTKKLSLKAETVRTLSGAELQNVGGGYVKTDFCQMGSGGNIYSTEVSEGADLQLQVNYQYLQIKQY